ncbi:glycosyltransferase [Streptomyces sp. B1866]|uniref:glycosyltransferase n=1 Tax=Streptomyces sp. B1866 TaxID=3075431 RepID=UPI00288FC706|nr:glycosyltransferase [Streptomyces sp. B1866]MDT3399358.1 glycosyltransferase [Streptomyces sp. B1866]
MRVIFCTSPQYSHLMPVVVPVARAAQRAGHQVAVATSSKLAPAVEGAGLPVLTLPNALDLGEVRQDEETVRRLGLDFSGMDKLGVETHVAPPSMLANLFAGPLARMFAEDLAAVCEEWKPDLLVQENSAFGAYYAAELLGIPRAMLDISPLAEFYGPEVLAEINVQRRALGLGPVDDPAHPFRVPAAGVVPEAFYPEHLRRPGARYYRPQATPAGQRLDPAVVGLPDDRPLVLATLGSIAPLMMGERSTVLHSIVEALGELPVTAVVAIGAERDPATDWPGARPDNVHLTSFAQQQLLLPACDLFVTHGGFSGVREALVSGVPMVALPVFAEQPANAERLAELGLGVRVDLERADVPTLTAACRTVLEDPSYRHRARGMQRRVLALPEFDQLVADLAELAA